MRNKFSMGSVMKKLAPVMLASVFLLPLSARAEIKAGSVEVTPFAGYNFFENRHNLKHQPLVGGRLGYNFTEHLGIEGTWEFMRSYVNDKSIKSSMEGQFASPMNRVSITQFHADLIYHFMPEKSFNPYIVGGYGVAHYAPKINNKNMSVINFGVGAKYWMADSVALRVDVRDNMVVDETIHNLETTLGVVFAFGGKSKAAPAPVEPPPAPVPVPVPKAVEPPPPAPPAVPTAALTVSPIMITKGQSTILNWKSLNASECDIQPGIGPVPPEGVRTITPATSTTYSLACSGAGGKATSAVGVTVVLPPPPAPLPPKAAAAAKRFCSKPAVLAINFDTNKSDIKPEYHDELKTVGDFLMYFPNAKGEISGHTDSTASNTHNQKLSDRRAESVGSYIRTTFGVNPDRITTKGYGETKPVASNKTKAGRAQNRRIVANFTCD